MALVVSSRPNIRVGEFLRDRIIRIVPLYWLVTLVWIGMHDPNFTTRGPVIRSLLFVPVREYFPVLGVGWSMNYEMFFYVLFAVIGLMFRRSVLWLAVPLALATALPHIIPGFVSSFYGNLIIWNFYAGIVIFYLHKIAFFQKTGALFFWAGVAALAIGIVIMDPMSFGARNPIVPWGIPSMAVVLGAVSTESAGKYVRVYSGRIIQLLGESSYCLYLIHPLMFILFNAHLIFTWRVQHLIGPDLTVVLLTAISCGVAIWAHKHVEMPMARFLKSTANRKPRSQETSAARAQGTR
jgi:peptidoglycan/LPS O-acetylase OafA/YrhL